MGFVRQFHRIVAAHKLGHAIQHPKINCSFVKNYTLQQKYF